jgi:PBP1b-binding outer membrane lipoprotein LpoB
MRLITMCLLIAGLSLLAGCATPESRIKKNPDLFASFPPDVQAKVQQGQIDIGFSPEMVTMALGTPNRVYTRQTKDGSIEVWSYTSTRVTNERQRVNANFRYRDASGSYRNANDWVYVDVARETEYERVRVEFTEGKVSAIDTLQQ